MIVPEFGLFFLDKAICMLPWQLRFFLFDSLHFGAFFGETKKREKSTKLLPKLISSAVPCSLFFSRLCVERKLSEKYTSNRIFCFQKEKKMSGVDHKQPAKQTAAPAAPVTELSNFYTWEWGPSELSLEWCSAKSRRSILFETISVFLSKIANSTNSSRSNTMCSSSTNYWGTN